MNADALNKLPRYIEAPGGGMWGPMPAGFYITNEDAIFVKLRDVEGLFSGVVITHKKVVVRDGVEYISVGHGSEKLVANRLGHNWNLHAWNSEGEIMSDCRGNVKDWEYFIKR